MKAKFKMPDGREVELEGTPQEIDQALNRTHARPIPIAPTVTTAPRPAVWPVPNPGVCRDCGHDHAFNKGPGCFIAGIDDQALGSAD